MVKGFKRRRLIALMTTIFMLMSFLTPLSISAQEQPKLFDLIEITDFHGAMEDSSTPPYAVAPVLAKNIKDIKAANPDRTLILGGGDLYQGSPISNVLQGVPVQQTMDSIGMEVTALGNHEFDWSLDTLEKVTMKDAHYSIVCANVYDKTTNKRVFDPYKIITKDGVKIAVIGAITTETPGIVMPKYVADYNFTDPVTEINSLVPEVRAAGAQVVIALIHEGATQNSDGTLSGTLNTIVNGLNGVDAVFGGHTHTKVAATVKGMPVVIGNYSGKGFIDLKMSLADGKVSFPSTSSSYIAIDNTNANGYKAANPVYDSDVKSILDTAKNSVGKVFSEKIGTASQDLTRTQDVSPYGESYLGNWSADVVRNAVSGGADVGMQNNGGIRINVNKGDITVGTIFYLMPFDNEINTVKANKAQLKAILEQAVMDGGKGIQISGIKMTYDYTKPSGNRITSITREDGKAIGDSEILTIAAPDFVATGGDGFAAFNDPAVKATLTNTHTLVRDAMIANVRANGAINAVMNNRITNSSKTISILGTSDVHGSIFNYDYATGKSANLGLVKVASYVNAVRAANPFVALVDAGDTIQGTPLSYYYDKIDTTSEYPMMKVMGAMKYDAWTLGNHEFNYGLDTLNRVIADAQKENINVLSANIRKTSDNSNFVKPYIIKSFTVNGATHKIGLLGLTTKTIPSWENPSNYQGLKFNDLVEEAKAQVPKMKADGAEVIVGVIHSGEESASDIIPENQIKAIATQVSGIDAIISGHVHKIIAQDKFTNPDGKTVLVTEPGKNGQDVSQVDIAVNSDGSLGAISTKVVPMDNSVAVDQSIANLAQPYQDKTMEYINTVIGKSTGEYSGAGQLTQPTAIMDLINKVQMQAANTQLSIAAPLSSSAFIPSGDVKIKDIMSVYVYENFLFGIKMTGAQLKKWMEYSVRYYKQASNASDKPEKDAALNIPDYNLDILYGATYDVDLTQPSGNRIKNLKFNGITIKDTDVFTVAINNYRFNGGGGFMAAAGLTPGDTSIVTYDSSKALGDDGQVRNLMVKYIQDNKTISPTVANNWELSTSPVAAKPDEISTLPKTGSPIDMGILIDFGALMTAAGAAIVFTNRKKKSA